MVARAAPGAEAAGTVKEVATVAMPDEVVQLALVVAWVGLVAKQVEWAGSLAAVVEAEGTPDSMLYSTYTHMQCTGF